MKKICLFMPLLATFSMQAQMSKGEVESMLKGVNMQEIQNIYLIRSRVNTDAPGWFEKSEAFDPKTCKWEFAEKTLRAEGSSYAVLIPYDKIKLIFLKKATYLTIELAD